MLLIMIKSFLLATVLSIAAVILSVAWGVPDEGKPIMILLSVLSVHATYLAPLMDKHLKEEEEALLKKIKDESKKIDEDQG